MTASVVLKQNELYHIYGVWLFRGTEMPPEFKGVDDVNYYTWTKVDHNNAEQKAWVDDLWSWESSNNWNGKGEFTAGRSWGC